MIEIVMKKTLYLWRNAKFETGSS